jgi:hypothetical protein
MNWPKVHQLQIKLNTILNIVCQIAGIVLMTAVTIFAVIIMVYASSMLLK